jgi:uncharacterized protein (DUF2252 family)
VRREITSLPAEAQRADGKRLRAEVPREALGEWAIPADRPDPVALLQEQAATRIADLVPIRYGRMLVSPFTFLRGSAAVMAADLARLPSSGVYTQCCGDAHLLNFGVFATPERRLVFDLNDFDETHTAPFEWDVRRLAVSVVIAGRDNGFAEAESVAATVAAVRRYRETVREASRQPFLDVWYSRIDVDAHLARIEQSGDRRTVRRTRKVVAKAATRTNLGALSKFAEQVDGGWRIREEPPLIVRIDPAATTPSGRRVGEVLVQAFEGYLASIRPDLAVLLGQYRFADVAHKVVGVGSVGTVAFMLLAVGPQGDDPLFLQIKEAQSSVLEPYTEAGPARVGGERVVTGQRLMQAASDQFLGWMRIDGLSRPYDFYVRQLRDWKLSLDVARMSPTGLADYAGACGEALARAHARAGTAPAIAGYLGAGERFDLAMGRFAAAYADQVERDHAALARAAGAGAVPVAAGL